jgi:NAD(P)H-hydrate epimerase
VAEIHAGNTGSAGAARIAAAGASAAGAGLVRIVVDDPLYPLLAPSLGGSMAVPASSWSPEYQKTETGINRFKPDVFLLGPGWGRGEKRHTVLHVALEAEKSGVPLILDADGITLIKDLCSAGSKELPVFNGRAILTPHAGELEILSGFPKERILAEPVLISELARKMNAAILFKSHVMILAAPDGRLGFIDGMDPSLGTGGSGDLLAGFCAGIAGRMRVQKKFDPYAAAAAAGTLLVEAGRCMGRYFFDPLELAQPAAALAGHAWL